MKDGHSDALKSLKEQVKEIGETLKAQRLRLERFYLDDRSWPLDVWRDRYLEDPLVSTFARRLIWSFELKGRWVAGLPAADGIFDATGAKLDVDAGQCAPSYGIRCSRTLALCSHGVSVW